MNQSTKKKLIQALWEEFTGTEKQFLINHMYSIGLISTEERDISINQTAKMFNREQLQDTSKVDEYYFTLSCFFLLYFGEEF